MKHITILIPEGDSNLSSIVGSYKILSRANEFWTNKRGKGYRIQLAGSQPEVGFKGGLFAVRPHLAFSAIQATDLVVVPSLNHNFANAIRDNQEMIGWIARQRAGGAEIASICTGAFMLAAAGLLDGKSCSTHWAAHHQMLELFPEVRLERDKLITDQDGLYTNGGAFSFLNLLLYLVEKYFDRETAIYCSKVFQIDMDRQSQSPYTIFTGQKRHMDRVIIQAQEYLEDNGHEKISMEDLAGQFALSRRNFDRRFIRATGNTPLEYLQRIRVEIAKKAFESTGKSIAEVMYEVGYSDVNAFRQVFRRITGVLPAVYKDRYNKHEAI